MPVFGIILWMIVIMFVLIGFIRCIRVVPQAQCWITELLGKYHSSWQPGLHVKIPFFEKVVNKVSLKERTLDFPPQGVITQDNVIMAIDAVVFMQVIDAKLYTYGAENPVAGVENLAATTLRNIVGTLGFDECLSARDKINTEMASVLDEATDPWGIKIRRVEVKSIQPPADICDAMAKQMKAERDRRETTLEAEAHKTAVVTRAEGDKQAAILKAEAEKQVAIETAAGRAESIRLLYQAEANGLRMLNDVPISAQLLSLKGIEALKDVADGNATKIFMPTEISKVVEMAGIFNEAFQQPAVKLSKPEIKQDVCCDNEGATEVTREIIQQEKFRNDIQNN